MKKLNGKALMVITLFLASLVATPVMVAGSSNTFDDGIDYNQDGESLIRLFQQGFGSIFGGMGYGGRLIGTVFEMMLLQLFTEFESSQILPNVYTISASIEDSTEGIRDATETEYYMVPYSYYEATPELAANDLGYAYCEVAKTGSYIFNYTVGVGITLVIWDNDGSFINALTRILNFFRSLFTYEGSPGGIPEDLIREGVELITWFLIHINDIFTGEELFILNPITWQKLEITPYANFSITKTMRVTGNDWAIGGPITDVPMNTLSGVVNGDLVLDTWNATAQTKKDSYMEWLLTETDEIALAETVFTSFTFDVIQLWIKNFEIHINVAEALSLLSGGGSGSINPADIFQGLDIEFFLFTHHLAGAFLYEDLDPDGPGPEIPDGKISSEYVRVNQSGTNTPILVDGEEVFVPRTNEITHRIMLGSVGSFTFEKPHITGTNKFSWGLTLNQAQIRPVPVGVDLDSYLGSQPEDLAYVHFGFTFEPKEIELPSSGGGTVPVLHGALKVDQLFAPWNDPETYGANNEIDGLDLAILYVSTVLHFHLTVDTLTGEGDEILDPSQDYEDVEHKLSIGNYLGASIAGKLDFVDIAGPYYEHGSESSRTHANASTAILPIALFEAELNAHETYEGTPGEVEMFAADIKLNISYNVMFYAVCFPEFEDGTGIWHDPTFSVYMIFEAQGFWAIILLVAGVGLIGVATILIKRRKDARF
ncbi:MAG: hypothetical protein ACFFFB_07450 [Candidatus Heimdallarchaeota archaeon]